MGKETKQTFHQRRYTIFSSCAYCRCTPSSLHMLIVDVHAHTHTNTHTHTEMGGMGRKRRSLTKETLIKISIRDHYLALLFSQEYKVLEPPWKKSMAVCCKTKYILLTQQSNTLLNIYPAAKSLQPCPTLCDPIDGSPAGPPIPGILQARTLEWVAISFSNA